MQVFHSLTELSGNDMPSVVTIGNFDGVHCGHRAVIGHVNALAREAAARSVVVTFDPHPAHVLAGPESVKLLTSVPHKLELLARTGIDATLVLPFTRELSRCTAETFAREILQDALHTVAIHEGDTFRFGHNAEGDIAGLTSIGERSGFQVHAYKPIMLRGAAVSSSRIRSLVAAGEVSTARALLGRPHSVRSTPASGRGYGTLYTVPTINLAPGSELLPANGVYVTELKVGTGPGTRVFRGVTNSGNRPTFGADSFAVETHLLDFKPIALEETTPLELVFLKRLRDERRFPSPQALREQIVHDARNAERFFALTDLLNPHSATL